jgi:hypothetical protein
MQYGSNLSTLWTATLVKISRQAQKNSHYIYSGAGILHPFTDHSLVLIVCTECSQIGGTSAPVSVLVV